MQIPFRINFVMDSLDGWEEVAKASEAPNPDDMPERIRPVEAIWIAQSYMRLKRRGHDVRLTDQFVPGEVCVALGAMKGSNQPYRSFAVSVQCHLLVARICDFNIVQNRLLLERPNQQWLPHWPQPGLIPRNPERGTTLERIAYFGDESLAAEFTKKSFRDSIADMGMTLITPEMWNDYADTDAVLAVRSVPPSYLKYKPASKLYNAWAAGCPAMLGPEPEFLAHRQSNLDFFEVRSSDDVLIALSQLKSKPELYRAMADNGLKRSADYSADAVARRWEELFGGVIADRYRAWKRGPKLWQQIRNASRFAERVVLHKRALRKIDYYNSTLRQTGFDWGVTGGVNMPSLKA